MGSCELPPGFRFHPTDEELIVHYLQKQAKSRPCPVSIIPELNIYKFDPWELPGRAPFGEEEWYFFTPRDRKYPNGARPNRATASGYWKATGTDKAIYSGSQYVGVKKSLVFYRGRPPKGTKTDWIMHEYRLGGASPPALRPNGSSSMRLDDWVLCRIYQKKQQKRATEHGAAEEVFCPTSFSQMSPAVVPKTADLQVEQPPPAARFPRSCSLAHLLEAAEYMPLSQMLGECSADAGDSFHAMAVDFGGGSGVVDWDTYAVEQGKSRGTASSALSNHPNLVVGPAIFRS